MLKKTNFEYLFWIKKYDWAKISFKIMFYFIFLIHLFIEI